MIVVRYGASFQTVTVVPVDDIIDNDGRSVSITHTALGGGYDDITAKSEITINDGDAADNADDRDIAGLSFTPVLHLIK